MALILALNLGEDGGGPADPDVAKALVMVELARVAAAGAAVMVARESGTLELRLTTGEIFVLGEKTVTRIA